MPTESRVGRAGAAVALALALTAAAPLAQSAASGALSLKDGRFVFGKPILKVAGGVEVRFEAAAVFVPDELIRDYFSTATDVSYEPKDDAEAAKVARGLVPFNGVWMTRARAEQKLAALQQEKQAALAAQKEAKRWMHHTTVDTKEFTFKHNVPDELFAELREMLEVYHGYFMRYWGKKSQLKNKPTIHIYADYDDFLQISGASQGVLGWYHLFSNSLHVFWDRTDPEYTVDVLFHEANHMLADMINGRFRYPHWIEESMAEYYGASEWQPATKSMTTGRVQAGRLAEVKADIAKGKMWSLQQLIHNQTYRSYTWGWSFIHFMMETPAYEERWKKLYLDLAHRDGMEREVEGPFKTVAPEVVEELLLKYTGHQRLETLEQEWHAYVQALDVDSVEGYERAGRKLRTMPEKQDEAREYLEKAVAMGAKNPHTYAALAQLLEDANDTEKGLAMIERALQLDPLDPEFYYAKGKLLKKAGGDANLNAAKRAFLLAAELDPSSWTYAIAAAE